jgi:hypothetical protein
VTLREEAPFLRSFILSRFAQPIRDIFVLNKGAEPVAKLSVSASVKEPSACLGIIGYIVHYDFEKFVRRVWRILGH